METYLSNKKIYRRLHGMKRATSPRAWGKNRRNAESCLRDGCLCLFKVEQAAAIRSSLHELGR